MKHLAVGLGTLVLATQIAGCGGGSSATGTATGPAVKNSENPDLPAEAREYEARQEANAAKSLVKAKAKPKNAR